MMLSNPNATKNFTAKHFRETKSFSSFPANVIRCMDYQDHHTVLTRDNGDQSVPNNSHITAALKEIITACIIVQLNESSAANLYFLAFAMQVVVDLVRKV